MLVFLGKKCVNFWDFGINIFWGLVVRFEEIGVEWLSFKLGCM